MNRDERLFSITNLEEHLEKEKNVLEFQSKKAVELATRLGRAVGRGEMAHTVSLTLDTLEANLDNTKLSDAAFREFTRTIVDTLRATINAE